MQSTDAHATMFRADVRPDAPAPPEAAPPGTDRPMPRDSLLLLLALLGPATARGDDAPAKPGPNSDREPMAESSPRWEPTSSTS